MKDLAIFRRMVMFCLLLGSVYLVFDTVVTSLKSKADKEEQEEDNLEAFNKLIEKFELLTPTSDEESADENGEILQAQTLVEQMKEKQTEEQNEKDRALAQSELLKSIKGQEANRLLESVAKPLIELEDIRVEPDLHIPEDLPDIANELVGTSPDDAN